MTVDEASSTTYEKGTSPTSASAIATGKPVLALGTTSGTTITATQVIGQIPASYNHGPGTIVNGMAAHKATEAALTAYPGVSSTAS